MTTAQWVLVGWLVLCGLAQFVRGIAGVTRTYTGVDAFGAVIEVGIMIWLVVSL